MAHLQDPFCQSIFRKWLPAILLLWALACLPVSQVFSQDDLNVHGTVSDAMTSSKLDAVKVTVKKDGSAHNTVTTRANGKYEFYLASNSKYEFFFEREGYITRNIVINAKGIPEEVVGAGIIMPTDMTLFNFTEAMKDANLSVFDQPIGIASYDAVLKDLVWDFNHTNRVKGEINAFIRDIEKKQKEMDKEASAEEKALAASEAQFVKYMADGDAEMGKKGYEPAVTNYKAAVALKPADASAKTKLADAESKWKTQKEADMLNADYTAAVDAADGFVRTEEYAKAVAKYQEALKLRPAEQYPKDKIAETNKIIADKAASLAKQEKFNQFMTQGETAFAEKEYANAIKAYEEALKILPDNQEASGKLAKARDAVKNAAELAALDAQYDKLVKDADVKFAAKSYEAAKLDYAAALQLKKDEPYPAERISAIDAALNQLTQAAEKQKAFDKLMADGNSSLSKQDFTSAIGHFEGALGIFADNADAKTKLNETRNLLAEREAEANKAARYAEIISAADKDFKSESFAEAKLKYEEARTVKPDETYPIDQLAKINTTLSALAAADAKKQAYGQAMAAGNLAVGANNFSEAIKQFENALVAVANDKDAQKALEDARTKKTAYEAQAATEQQYTDLVAQADKKMSGDQLAEAKTDYQAALKLKPAESYPSTQIASIESTLAQRAKEAADAAEIAALRAQFDGIVKKGDDAMASKDFGKGIAFYEEALDLISDDAGVKAKLESARAGLSAAESAADLNKRYNDLITSADAQYKDKQYDEARAVYAEAAQLKVDESYPKSQIAKIDTEIAATAEAEKAAIKARFDAAIAKGDEAVKAGNFMGSVGFYEESLVIVPGDPGAQAKLDKAKLGLSAAESAAELDRNYNALIANADQQYAAKQYEEARSVYQEAAQVKPSVDYPKQQISKIDEELASKAAAEANAEMQARIEKVNGLVLAGDNARKSKSFENAIAKYEEALGLMPERTDIQQKISDTESDMLAAMESAASQEAYDDAIAQADKAFDKQNWTEAKSAYETAVSIKSSEAYPKERITDINNKMEALAREKSAAETELLMRDFNKAINAGNDHLAKAKYDKALSSYEDALSLIPDSEIALQKIAEVNQILGAESEANAANVAYQSVIKEADDLFAEESYEMAKMKYADAMELKPSEPYPPKKIGEIDFLLEKQILAEQASETASVDRAYNDALRDADDLMRTLSYELAISGYQDALEIKPAELYPTSQIERAQLLISEREQAIKDRLLKEALALEAKNKKPKDNFQTVNSNSEEQAEDFMRDAREAQEKEKYERIKKQKSQIAATLEEYNQQGEMNRRNNSETIDSYSEANQFEEGKSRYDSRVKNSVKYKKALLANTEKRSETGMVRLRDAANELEATKENQDNLNQQRAQEQNERIAREQALKDEQLKQVEDWSKKTYANRKAQNTEIRQKAVSQYARNEKAEEKRSANSKRVIQEIEELNSARTNRAQEELEKIRTTSQDIRKSTEENQSDMRAKGEARLSNSARESAIQKENIEKALLEGQAYSDEQRIKNKEEVNALQRGAKEDTDYHRTELALEYPQGVTEESSTLGNKVIITRFVVKGNRGDEYKKVLDKAGNYYFKNGQSISEQTWNRETLDAFYKKD